MSDFAVEGRDVGLSGSSPAARDRTSRSRFWWVIVLLLLLLMLGCAFLHLVFPGPRGAILATGNQGLTPVFSIYGLNEPRGVSAGPEGQIAVSDTGAQRAYVYGSDGVLITRLGGDLPADRVFSVAGSLYEEDAIYLCDWGLNRVWLFGENGAPRDWFPEDPMAEEYGPGGFYPFDIARLGDDLIVATRTGLFRFDGATLELIGRFGPAEVGGYELDYVTGLDVDAEAGLVCAADSFNRRVVAYDTQGSPLWALGRPDEEGKIVSFFALPRDVAFTERGLLVSDAFRHELYLLGRDGELLGTYGTRGVMDGELNFPEGLAVAPDGLLCVADRANDRVQVLALGDPLESPADVISKWDTDYVDFR